MSHSSDALSTGEEVKSQSYTDTHRPHFVKFLNVLTVLCLCLNSYHLLREYSSYEKYLVGSTVYSVDHGTDGHKRIIICLNIFLLILMRTRLFYD